MIGTLRETSLHAEIKNWYRRANDEIEVEVNGYLIDIVRNDSLIEIQTGNFSSVREKFSKLLPDYPVRVVHPIPITKWVSRYDNNNNVKLSSRKSPQHKSIHSLFDELVYLPEIVVNENFSLEILLIEQEDVWINDGKGSWRRKYWRIADRNLLSVLERVVFYQPPDFRALLPAGLSTNFTSLDLSEMIGVQRHLAMKMLNCLRKMHQVEIVGKENRAYLYSISER